jgi:hypothetical protein
VVKSCEYGDKPLCFIKGREFLDKLSVVSVSEERMLHVIKLFLI